MCQSQGRISACGLVFVTKRFCQIGNSMLMCYSLAHPLWHAASSCHYSLSAFSFCQRLSLIISSHARFIVAQFNCVLSFAFNFFPIPFHLLFFIFLLFPFIFQSLILFNIFILFSVIYFHFYYFLFIFFHFSYPFLFPVFILPFFFPFISFSFIFPIYFPFF